MGVYNLSLGYPRLSKVTLATISPIGHWLKFLLINVNPGVGYVDIGYQYPPVPDLLSWSNQNPWLSIISKSADVNKLPRPSG